MQKNCGFNICDYESPQSYLSNLFLLFQEDMANTNIYFIRL